MNINTFQRFLYDWFNHPMRTSGRQNLDRTDKTWNDIYEKIIDSEFEEELLFQGNLLFRALTGGKIEPKLSDYDDFGAEQEELFQRNHDFWVKQNDINAIEFDNHWVSFTDSVDVINSDYFADKKLNGFVVVTKPKKAINAHLWRKNGFDEREVVAPMDESTVVEILPFDDFIKKYHE